MMDLSLVTYNCRTLLSGFSNHAFEQKSYLQSLNGNCWRNVAALYLQEIRCEDGLTVLFEPELKLAISSVSSANKNASLATWISENYDIIESGVLTQGRLIYTHIVHKSTGQKFLLLNVYSYANRKEGCLTQLLILAAKCVGFFSEKKCRIEGGSGG